MKLVDKVFVGDDGYYHYRDGDILSRVYDTKWIGFYKEKSDVKEKKVSEKYIPINTDVVIVKKDKNLSEVDNINNRLQMFYDKTRESQINGFIGIGLSVLGSAFIILSGSDGPSVLGYGLTGTSLVFGITSYVQYYESYDYLRKDYGK
jgi:hypothetical protein